MKLLGCGSLQTYTLASAHILPTGYDKVFGILQLQDRPLPIYIVDLLKVPGKLGCNRKPVKPYYICSRFFSLYMSRLVELVF